MSETEKATVRDKVKAYLQAAKRADELRAKLKDSTETMKEVLTDLGGLVHGRCAIMVGSKRFLLDRTNGHIPIVVEELEFVA